MKYEQFNGTSRLQKVQKLTPILSWDDNGAFGCCQNDWRRLSSILIGDLRSGNDSLFLRGGARTPPVDGTFLRTYLTASLEAYLVSRLWTCPEKHTLLISAVTTHFDEEQRKGRQLKENTPFFCFCFVVAGQSVLDFDCCNALFNTFDILSTSFLICGKEPYMKSTTNHLNENRF